MARIPYDDLTATAYKAVREIPRDGLGEWREAVRRHLRPSPGTVVADVGAGTGQFAVALAEWFDIDVVAVEPSAAMRAQIPERPTITVLEGHAGAIPLEDRSVDGVWLSLVIHHIPDLEAAAYEIRRILRPGGPVMIRQGFAGRLDRVENVRWFPETATTVDLTVGRACEAFAAAGFGLDAREPTPETYSASLADYLAQLDVLRRADSTLRMLTDQEFEQGVERVRCAGKAEGEEAAEPRTNWLDLLVLR